MNHGLTEVSQCLGTPEGKEENFDEESQPKRKRGEKEGNFDRITLTLNTCHSWDRNSLIIFMEFVFNKLNLY